MERKVLQKKESDCIRLSHITKTFGSQIVFDDFSMEFPKGETTCLMGASGAGKTTLLRILLGLEGIQGGSIQGMDGMKKSAVFQEPRLLENLSAFANIGLVRKKGRKRPEAEREISDAMKAVGLGGCEHQRVHEMSGGMRRRVALLRALYAEWDILFLDEPFQGLDESCREMVMAYTKKACAGKTVLLVTHSQTVADEMGKNSRFLQ